MKRPIKPKRESVFHLFPQTVGGLQDLLQMPRDSRITIGEEVFCVEVESSEEEYQAAMEKYEKDLLEYKKFQLEKLKKEVGGA